MVSGESKLTKFKQFHIHLEVIGIGKFLKVRVYLLAKYGGWTFLKIITKIIKIFFNDRSASLDKDTAKAIETREMVQGNLLDHIINLLSRKWG